MTTLAQVQAMLPGSTLMNSSEVAAEQIMISRVGTDSRQIEAGELFVALAGERFDAHDFFSEHILRSEKIDRIVVALAHLRAIETGNDSR